MLFILIDLSATKIDAFLIKIYEYWVQQKLAINHEFLYGYELFTCTFNI